VGVQLKVGTLGVNEPGGVAVWSYSGARLKRRTIIGLGRGVGGSTRFLGSVDRTPEGKQ